MKKENNKNQWTKVGYFGNGVIMARGDERKMVTPNREDFNYSVKPLIVRNKQKDKK